MIDPREQERLAAEKANRDLTYPKPGREAQAAYEKYRSSDPFPDVEPALLNSAHIAEYVSMTGMISPFYPEKLKSASYSVALLGKYVYIDSKGKKKEGELKKGDEITVEKNSITFLTVEPTFRLPDYIALRHNLKINHVYKGLLVGTGPLIDPGFVGKISLPLHNLTQNAYTFRGGEGIIWVEFTKLSTIRTQPPAASPPTVPAPNHGGYIPYPASTTSERGVRDYVRQAVGHANVPASSTAKTARVAKSAKKRVNTLTVGASLTVIGVVLGLVATILTINNATNGRVDKLRDDNDANRDRIIELERINDALSDLTEDLRKELAKRNAGPARSASGP